VKKRSYFALLVLLLWGCPREQKQPTLEEILGDAELLKDAFADNTLSNVRTGPPPPPPPPLPKTGPVIISDIQVLQGALQVPAVHKNFLRRQGSLRNCYAATLRESPKNQGQVGVKLAFDERGRVTEALILESTMTHPISDCLLAKLKRFRFPKQSDSQSQVKALLKFSPQ